MIGEMLSIGVLGGMSWVIGRTLVEQLRDERDWSAIEERERAARALRRRREP